MQEDNEDHVGDAGEETLLSEALGALARASLSGTSEAEINQSADRITALMSRLRRLPIDPDSEPDFYWVGSTMDLRDEDGA